MTPIALAWMIAFLPAGTAAEWMWRFDSPAEVTSSSNLSLARVGGGVFCGMTRWDPHFSLNLRGELLDAARTMGAATGVFPAPEGAACLAAQVRLLEDGWIRPDESVLLFNTGTGLKYAHLWA